MKKRIVNICGLVILVWLHSPTQAQAPLSSFRTLSPALPPGFYDVIVTNNLFRPLGWTPPKSAPAFELIATVMKSDGNHKALIRNTGTRQVYYSPIGELAAGTFIKKIEPRRVTLNQNGISTVYILPDF